MSGTFLSDRLRLGGQTVAACGEPGGGDLYRYDYLAWLEHQARAARDRRVDALDLGNLAEELDDMGRSERSAVDSHFTRLLAHLLKYVAQPEARSGSWRGTITEARQQIRKLLRRSPSLKEHLLAVFTNGESYADAMDWAASESGLPVHAFPPTCPYTLEQILDRAFWPGPGPHPDLTPPPERARA